MYFQQGNVYTFRKLSRPPHRCLSQRKSSKYLHVWVELHNRVLQKDRKRFQDVCVGLKIDPICPLTVAPWHSATSVRSIYQPKMFDFDNLDVQMNVRQRNSCVRVCFTICLSSCSSHFLSMSISILCLCNMSSMLSVLSCSHTGVKSRSCLCTHINRKLCLLACGTVWKSSLHVWKKKQHTCWVYGVIRGSVLPRSLEGLFREKKKIPLHGIPEFIFI